MLNIEKINDIKKHLLDLAIKGKLVEQRLEEGTAEELYNQIQDEKQKLIKDGKIKKEKPLAPIEDEEIPFDIPDSWEWVRLSDCIEVNPNVIFDDEQDVSFIPMTNICAGYKSEITLCEVKKWGDVRKNFSRFQENDVVIAKITPCFQNRKSAIAKNLVNKYGAGTTELNILRCRDTIYNRYVLFFAKSEYFISYGVSHFSGTAGQQRFAGDSLKNMLFPLPPLSEQKRIVEKLEYYFSVLNNVEDLIIKGESLGKRLKETILDYAIQGKLVEQRPEEGTAEELYNQIQEEKQKLIKEGKLKKEKPLAPITDDEIPFEIPDSWKWVRLGGLLQVISGVSYQKKDVSNSGLRILRGGNIQNLEIKLEDDDVFLPNSYYDENKMVRRGDIVLVASTGSKTVIGKPAFAKEDYLNTSIGAFLRICRPISSQLFDFINAIFASEYYRNHIRSQVQGTNINNIKENHITDFIVPLPPLSEQKRIVAKIEELVRLCEQLSQ